MIKSSSITITLQKAKPREQWTDVKPKIGLLGEMKPPPREKTGEDPTMTMMKDMYNKGDDDMKRMINETFIKSQED